MGSALLISIAVFALLAVWVNLVRAAWQREAAGTRRLDVRTPDGWTLAVWHHAAAQRRFAEPVVLCHGLANNHRFLDFEPPQSLAAHLAALGFEVYSVDLRGAGQSLPPDGALDDATVDDHIRFDVPAVVDAVARHAGAGQVLWVGHSLGGLVGLSASAMGLTPRLKGMVTIGSPVFFGFNRRVDYMVRVGRWLAPAGRFPTQWLAELAAPLSGRFEVNVRLATTTANLKNIALEVQPRLMANVFAPMWRGVLLQLEDWVRRDHLRSLDGSVDYRAAIAQLDLPLLVVSGTVDRLAKVAGQRRYFEVLRSSDKTLVVLGKSNGQSEEYGHGDLIVGKRAHEEVYPVIGGWLEARATPVADGGGAQALSA